MPQMNADIHQWKVVGSVWWEFKDIMFFEFVSRNQKFDLNVYSQLLDIFKVVMFQNSSDLNNHENIMFQQDNAGSHKFDCLSKVIEA